MSRADELRGWAHDYWVRRISGGDGLRCPKTRDPQWHHEAWAKYVDWIVRWHRVGSDMAERIEEHDRQERASRA